MISFIVCFIYMNIGIAWILHRGEADWCDIDEKIYVQIHAILWPLSMIVNFWNDFYLWNKREKYKKENQNAQAPDNR